ncbi:MAG: glycosyltransferase family 4 protein [Flavobacterium sp.]|nr:MAG: glycosyltransferase family 4 protein [Flavobacterium sp.]
MKILFSTDQTYLHGGIEKIMAAKANYLADLQGYEVHILTTEQKGNAPCYQLSPKISQTDLAVNYHRQKSYFHPSNFVKIPGHFGKLSNAIKSIRPDIIIVCNYAFDFYRMPFIFKNIPKLKEYHSSGIVDAQAEANSGLLKRMIFSLNEFIASKYDRLVLLNPDEKSYYASNNTVIIPNFVDVPDFRADLNAKKAIAAGRIAPVKGFENLIGAWKLVAAKHPDWQVHIYGQGEESYIGSLRNLIEDFGLEKNVFILPATNKLVEKMSEYSMCVMSSQTECFPMVLLESLSVGLPIVSFDCETGPRNIITNNEDGLLAKNQNVEDLAAKIITLIDDVSLRKTMGSHAKTNVSRFSKSNVMAKWLDLFNELKSQN